MDCHLFKNIWLRVLDGTRHVVVVTKRVVIVAHDGRTVTSIRWHSVAVIGHNCQVPCHSIRIMMIAVVTVGRLFAVVGLLPHGLLGGKKEGAGSTRQVVTGAILVLGFKGSL